MSAAYRILLVEDSDGDALLIQKALKEATGNGCKTERVENLASALKAASETDYDVALLDMSLPDTTKLNGLLSLQNIAPKLPVVILTAYADKQVALSAVESGAQDYLFKDKATGATILHAIEYAIQRKRFEATLIQRAHYDAMTGLANRQMFENRLDMALARNRRGGKHLGVLFMDLDRFKPVNDTYGHAAGDQLLKQVALRLKSIIRPYDTAARFGGDEFALLIEDPTQKNDCEMVARKLLQAMAAPFDIAGTPLTVGMSIGIAVYTAGEETTREALMQQADEAMYSAKQDASNRFCVYGSRAAEKA